MRIPCTIAASATSLLSKCELPASRSSVLALSIEDSSVIKSSAKWLIIFALRRNQVFTNRIMSLVLR